MPRLCENNPGICLTTEERARKNLSQHGKTSPRPRQSLSVPYVAVRPNFVARHMKVIRLMKIHCQLAAKNKLTSRNSTDNVAAIGWPDYVTAAGLYFRSL
jgi:hypothetical protein